MAIIAASKPPPPASDKKSKGKVREVLKKKVEDVTRKAEALADHLKFSQNISEAAKARLAQSAKMFVEGGSERVFQLEFGVIAKEKLLNSFVCYISTTSKPVTGRLYISNRRIAFCSDFAIRHPSSAAGNGVPENYKDGGAEAFDVHSSQELEPHNHYVVVELEKIKNIGESSNMLKPSEKYLKVETQDGLTFWFMGFVSYMDAYNCLKKALHNIHYDSDM